MRIVKCNDYHPSHTKLSKIFTEILVQRLDTKEIISNKHKTTNGFVLITELIDVGLITIKRAKSIQRFKSLLEEAKSDLLDSSVVNDFILCKYTPDIVEFFNKIDVDRIKESHIFEIVLDCKKFHTRLKDEYFHYIFKELLSIDFKSDKFNIYSHEINRIIDCFIPYILYRGYSIETISDLANIYISKEWQDKKSVIKFLNHFRNAKRKLKILIKTPKDTEEAKFLIEYLRSTNEKVKKIDYNSAIKEIYDASNFDYNGEDLYEITPEAIDPHSKIRLIYEKSLKNLLFKGERLSLQYFTTFFENIYWKFDNNWHKYQTASLPLDPINVKNRASTLRHTLYKLSSDFGLAFNYRDDLPKINSLKDAIYYYNFALGSKSIENSISLLWTALECLLPYRRYETDIENVQYFVSKCLSLGVIGRQLYAFVLRFLQTNKENAWALDSIATPNRKKILQPETMADWSRWLCTEFLDEDPYKELEPISNLLCKEFCFLNEIYSGKHIKHKTINYFITRIKKSETSIKYQLDRIYLHRNQIVHSGKFINEYSNLWSHLEWYVGKLLAYGFFKFMQNPESEFNKELVYLELEADADAITNILTVNKDKPMVEIASYFEKLFTHTWQFF